ncbi:5'/3'-nucleotidase SurE [Cryomorpha ignava]|uniref:5'-nucleotidase SurE n=1 Tax=Cryomorpha ignava TaxID=101383 RepID=A0A7K3WKX0_9FLAO|nr:5'/3'-nucleotidase SurE [Cryomorpha ignava]NEN22178.1 5'/3'-nucleotidase SurE [Cryomorpha ignava]
MEKSNERPLILVTNDDGITAGGIRSLIEVAKEFGDVWVVAPDSPQSAMGHAITVHNILRLHEVKDVEGVNEFSCTGTPVDCVKLAIYRVLKRRPDLLLSGINHGANNSINVLYSGTMSAAVEGAVEGIPSIGFSLLDHSAAADFTASKKIARAVIKNALANGIPEDTCLNVNIPNVPYEEIKGVRVCRQAKAFWEDSFQPRKDPAGRIYYWITGNLVNHDSGEDTDVWALENNFVSVVPVQYDLTAHRALKELNDWKYEI